MEGLGYCAASELIPWRLGSELRGWGGLEKSVGMVVKFNVAYFFF